MTLLKTLTEAQKINNENINFNPGFLYRINEYRGLYPVLMCEPLKLINSVSDGKGKTNTYKVNMFLFVRLTKDDSEDDKTVLFEKMDDFCIALIAGLRSSLSTTGLQSFYDFAFDSDEYAFDTRGSLCTTINMTLDVYDCA